MRGLCKQGCACTPSQDPPKALSTFPPGSITVRRAGKRVCAFHLPENSQVSAQFTQLIKCLGVMRATGNIFPQSHRGEKEILPLYGGNKVLNAGRKQTVPEHTTAEAQGGGCMAAAAPQMQIFFKKAVNS